MNLFSEYHIKITKFLKKIEKKEKILLPSKMDQITFEPPPKNLTGDISTNLLFVISRINNTSPMIIGEKISLLIKKEFKEFERIEIKKPGFINFYFTNDFWRKYINILIKTNKKYGTNKISKKKINVEFVSANPTGPLHVGHCRGAILGDVISNLLEFNGNKVTREYYINDFGKQIDNFVQSVHFRMKEILFNEKLEIKENLYPGEYIIDIAKLILSKKNIKNPKDFEKNKTKIKTIALHHVMSLIKKDLHSLGVRHNKFISENDLVKNKEINKAIKKLEKKNLVYEGKLNAPKSNEGSSWTSKNLCLFKSTQFGDDVDRALTKDDGEWTYFAGDIAYHSNKIDRKYDSAINILGSDHTGYVKRLESAFSALSNNRVKFKCKISQMVKLYKSGQPFKMSKRKGDYITVKDLINEVGKDAARFIMLNRSNDMELDFDFEKVKEKTKENPVYYVQYAYARINSVFSNSKVNLNEIFKLKNNSKNFNEHEIQLIKKISEWPNCVKLSADNLEPHKITFFLYDLATIFHAYWNLGKQDHAYKFIDDSNKIKENAHAVLKCLAIVIRNGMKILGVSTPSKM